MKGDAARRVDTPSLFNLNFFLLFMAHLFFGFAFWPYVLLPVFLQNLGSDLSSIGVIMGAASVSGILIRPWIGVALERIGRKRCLFIGGLIFLVAHFFYLSIDEIGWAIYGVRLIHGLGVGILFSTFFTLAADLSPETRRTEGIALFGVAGHLSGALGIPLGEWVINLGGYTSLFKACAGFTLLFMAFSHFLKTPATHTPNPLFGAKQFMETAALPINRVPLAATGLFAVGLISYMTFLKPYAHTLGIGVSSFFLAYSLTAVAVRLLGGTWPDRFGLMRVLYPALFSLSAGITLLALWPSPSGLILSGVLCGIGHGFIFPILSVLLLNRGPGSERGARMALFTLFFDIGIFIGSPLWGLVAEGFGYTTMFFLSAATVLISVGAFLFLDRRLSLTPILEVEGLSGLER